MKRKIIIIGGGISGLAVLHYLKIKYYFRTDVEIKLFEKEDQPGGTITTTPSGGCLFENGPNGFLDSKKKTLEFVQDLNLTSRLIKADTQSKARYISINNELLLVPSSPKAFLKTKLLNPLEKLEILKEVFVKKAHGDDESVYGFGERRLGKTFSERFLDPMVSGIYGGDAKELVMKEAFPKIYHLEQAHGSLFKAMFALKKSRKGKTAGQPGGSLTSFINGMSEMIDHLHDKYRDHIVLNQEVQSISQKDQKYVIYSKDKQLEADHVFVCTPAYVSSHLLNGLNKQLRSLLDKVYYAPIAVIGLKYDLNHFNEVPHGFGYLIPSTEKKDVLGVLFDSNIFPNRSDYDSILFRVMIGGARHPHILEKSEEALRTIAIKEIKQQFRVEQSPNKTFSKVWPKAIPQYNKDYVAVKEQLNNLLQSYPNLHLVANYLNGISMNDCIENSFNAVMALPN